jgi:hypothetical protein
MSQIIETTDADGNAVRRMTLEEYVKARLNIGENLCMECIMTISKFLPADGQRAIATSIATAGPAMQQLEEYFTAHGVREDSPRLLVYKD